MTMTLDEAIQHCEEVAEKQDKLCEISVTERAKEQNSKCASERRQLAEWLKELKTYREQSGDAISRDELLKAMDTWDKFGYTETGCFVREPKNDCVKYIHYDDIIKCIKGMPSVTLQTRIGRWIPVGYDGYADGNPVYDWWECSECGWEHTGDEESLTAFCPNCGARMEVEE